MVTLQKTIGNKLGDLEFVRNLVFALERACALTPEMVFDINVVLDELLSNIIKYGYSDDAAHEIRVKLSATDTAVEIVIEDDGKAFDPFAVSEPDLSLPLAERPVGGLGVHFVRKLMDEVQYKRENNRNLLFLKKNIVS